ncbi:hypothetical protein VPNG_03855 [Cytospora leucostoma]|uniref:SUN domain-containing protein n=1 Tax=Cytospora leucostoma TaxID=1230097 RepID=A0A423XE02_9PEZI|nr:hypothetical protein VPNG_03855 [Cytospora leucostoma]
MRPLISPSILWLWTLVVLSANHGSAQDTSAVASTEVCQSRTINYITHTLPQQCLRTSWSAANSITNTNTTNAATTTTTSTSTLDTVLETATTTSRSTKETVTSESSTQSKTPDRKNATENNEDGPGEEGWAKQEDDDAEDLATSSFMSFEEWKARMLRKSGQDPADHKEKKHHVSREADPAAHLETWGDDGEIALDFDVLSDKISEMTAPARARSTPASSNAAKAEVQEPAPYDDGVAHYRRPKDAGKTCKERFSYSSFDGGATVLKTSPGAQNAKAILVENKDSYMLFECKQENRFVIVELSDDILVDTVVLANFEFFSSMIRTFRVSVSDKYPVKIDKWKDIGTFQARNSRDLQSFLIENPMIWAKYIRIEFLSHYGNEYYCPVSLLRVHGTRMLDSWKEAEAGAEEDEPAETITGPEAVPEQELVHEEAPPSAPEATHIAEQPTPIAEKVASPEIGLSPWHPSIFASLSYETCGIGTPTTTETVQVSPPVYGLGGSPPPVDPAPSTQEEAVRSVAAGEPTASSTTSQVSSANTLSASADAPKNSSISSTSTVPVSSGNDTIANTTKSKQESIEPVGPRSSVTPPQSSSVSKVTNSPSSRAATSPHSPGQPPKANQSRNATSTTSSASSSPTIQESFFKSVSKRLQFLESNTTMSLQYIEEQSRFLQEALKKMERRQISRVDTFLSNLNNTVFSELQRVRQDYDQIWQSTVIALETQREQSQRDILALRDEVRFQKHMAIFQAVMLLCCLVLVVFSRGVLGNTGIVGDQWPVASTSQFINSYLASPRWSPGSPRTAARVSTPVRNGSTLHPGGAQATSRIRHGHIKNMSYTEKVLPMTPTSEGFDSHDNDTDLGSPMPTPPRLQTPTIRAHKPGPEGIPGIQKLGQEDSSSAPEISEEVVSSSDDAPTGVPDSIETMADDEEGGQQIIDEDKTQQSSEALSTRPPLLGPDVSAASRKPLPALPEQVST